MRRLPSLTEGLSFAAMSYGVSVAIAIASGIVMARLYGIEVVGEFALVTAAVGSLWFLSTIREQPAFIRLVARLSPRDSAVTGLFVAVFAFSSALTLVAVLLVTGGSYLLYDGLVDQPQLFAPALANMGGYLLLANPGWNLDSVFVAYGDGRRLFWIRLNQSIAFLVLVIVLSFVMPTVWGPVVATIFSWVTSLVHRVAVVGEWMGFRASADDLRAGFRKLPEIIKFGLKLAPGSIAAGLSGQTTTWVLGAMTTVATVGAYSRAATISTRFSEINQRIREMLFPALVRRRDAGDHEAFARALTDSIRLSMAGLLLPAAIVGGASTAMMGLYGSEFEFAAPALAITMLSPALLGGNGMRVAAVTAIDRPLSVTYARVAAIILKLAVIVPLVLAWGITGAAIAPLLRSLLVNTWLNVVIRKHLGIPARQLYPARQLGTMALAYAVGFGAAALLQNVLPQPFGLMIALVAGAVAYVATYVALGGPTERDRQRFRAAVARVRRRRAVGARAATREGSPATAEGEGEPAATGARRA
jgi:O-antigen/teichoic acid export membrane protein